MSRLHLLTIALLAIPVFTSAASYFQYDDKASCQAGEYGVTLNDFGVVCDTLGCKVGESMMIYGNVTTEKSFPNVFYVQVNICNFWGLLCTADVFAESRDVCYFANMQNDESSSCSTSGSYAFEADVAIPEYWLIDYMIPGYSFNIYLDLDNGDVNCHAQFYSGGKKGSSSGYSAAGLGFLSVGVFGYALVARRKRKAKLNLLDEETMVNGVITDYEGMIA